MATKGMTVQASVLFNGTQAAKELEQLKKRAEALEAQMSSLRQSLGEGYEDNKGYKELLKQFETVNSLVNAGTEKLNFYSQAMDNMTGMTVRQLQAATTQAKNFQRSFSDTTAQEEVSKTANLIEQITARIKQLRTGFTDTMQVAQNTTGMTVNELQRLHGLLIEEQKLVATDEKLWTRYQNTIDKVGNAINAYAEENKKLVAIDVVNNLDIASEKEIRNSIKALQELQTTLSYGLQEWEDMGVQIKQAEDYLKNFDAAARQNTMVQQFSNLQNLSASALGEQKKYWTEVMNAAAPYSQELDAARQKLEAIQQLEQTRTKSEASKLLTDVQSGNFSGTIAQTKEAIQQLEKYRSLLDVKDVQGITATEEAIAQLNRMLADSNNQWANYRDAINATREIEDGTFAGTYQDLEKIRKSLIAYKAQLKTADTVGLTEVNQALRQIDIAQNQAKNGFVDINVVMDNLNTVPLDQLQLAAKQLEERLKNAARGTEDFIRESAQLRQIRAQIEQTNRAWQNQENVIVRTAKRLASYVLVYAGFNEVVGQVKRMASANLELSDSLADIQKTTGLSADAIDDLSRSIDEIDTRTGQQQLHELAAVAGQIGLTSQEDVLGFVKASNMITVALNELGSEGTASLMKLAQLTGDVQKMGVEKSLMAIGSSINELSASSAATSGPIVDLMNRLGGIAAQSRISTAELAAIGATADALGQSMEITGTSMSKFIATLLSSSDKVAYAVNMDAKALRDMIDSGRTMDAIIAVMQKMNEMGGIASLAPIMGDLGSEGARMMTMLSAMANNVDFLAEQVDLSRNAFSEATSIQNEYNVKNENAIAILQRMGNAMKEAFVNSGVVSAMKAILSATMDVFSWFAKGEAAARTFTSVIVGLTTALLANRLAWVQTLKTMSIAAIFAKIGGWISAAKVSVIAFGQSMLTASTYTNMAILSVNKLKAALTKNWFTFLIGALTSLGVWLYKTMTYVSELTKTQAKYNAELETELTKVDALFYALNRYNIEKAEQKKIIDQINKQYGDYLGFMISETDSAEKLAAAHRLVNAELRKKMALNLQSKLEENVSEQFADRLNDLMTSMGKSLSKAQGIGEQFSREAVSIVTDVIRNNVDKPTEEILEAIKSGLANKYDTTSGSFGSSAFFDIQKEIKNLIQARKDYQNGIVIATEYSNSEIKKATSMAVEEGANMLNQLTNTYNELANKDVSTLNKEEVEAHYKELLTAAQDYVSAAGKQMERLGEDEKKSLQNVVTAYNAQIEDIKKKMPSEDVWGKSLNLQGWKESLDNLSTASVESLVKVYKELQDAPKLISDVTKYNEMFGTSFTSLGQVMEDTKNKAKQIKDQLASMGRNTAGNFLWGGNGGNRSAVAEAKREYEAALSALESYYNSRETLIREKAMQENQTEEELQRNLDAMEEEHLKARIALRKKILSKADTSFETNYAQVAASDFFKGIDLNKLSDQLGKFGKQLTQGVERQMTEDEVKILEKAWKIQTQISKILLTNDFSKQVNKQMQDSFEQTGLFWGKETDRSRQAADERMDILRQYAKDAYRLEADELRDRMELNETFGSTVYSMNKDQYAAFLLLLQEYHDKTIEADKKNVALRKRIIEQQWEEEGYASGYKAADSTISNASADLELMQNSGAIANEQQYFDSVQELTLQRVALEEWKYEQMRALYEKNNATEEMYRQLEQEHLQSQAEAQRSLLENYMARYQKMAEITTSYGSIIGDGFGNMIAGQEDAGKQLIKNLLTETINMASEFAKRLILQQTFGTAMQQIKNTQNAQQVASAYAAAMQEIGIEASKMTAIQAIATGKITAESMAQPDSILTFGASGAARAAIIIGLVTAATSAALALVNSLFSGSASEASAASSRRLTTGMLTYAEGDYPVLGNDGQIYNARYQKDLKTGVYGGGAHFGIFSEKKPEMIVDGNTTEKLILNYPHIYDAITTIAKHGRLKNAAMPTYASGNYPAGMKNITSSSGNAASDADGYGQMQQMQATIASMNATISALNATLANGIGATINPYANYKAEEKANRFMKKRGMKK